MKEKFRAEEREIREMFNNKRYIIPRNQREFVWDTNNFQDLWDDIINTLVIRNGEIEDKRDYFIGSCVIMPTKNNSYTLIDGQQRFTTLIIFLSALCEIFKKENMEKLQSTTYRYIQNVDDYGEKYFTIKNEYLNPYFETSIMYIEKETRLPSNEQQKNLKIAYEFYLGQLEKIQMDNVDKKDLLIAIRDQILNLRIVEITVHDEDDGYTIFEILNARGKELEVNDLIKNWCMKKMPHTFPIDTVKDVWDKITQTIEKTMSSKNSMQVFLNHYFLAKYHKPENDKEMYRFIRKTIKSSNVKEFIDELYDNSKVYLMICKPAIDNVNDPELLHYLEFFRTHRITQVRPLLLALIRNYEIGKLSLTELNKYLKKLHNFHSVYTVVCKAPGNSIEKIYHNYSTKIYNDYSKTVLEEMLKELISKKPSFDEFQNRFNEKGYSNKTDIYKSDRNSIKHILAEFENSLHITNELQIKDFTIEHISPDLGVAESSSIGNLLMLAKKLNERAQDYTLDKKIIYYKNSEFLSVKEFLKNHGTKPQWIESDIQERTRKLATYFYMNVWK